MAGYPAGPRAAVMVGVNRIPFARANRPYAQASNQDMPIAALDGLVARFGLSGEAVGEVAAGAVLKHSGDFNLTRESVLGSQLSPTTPAYEGSRRAVPVWRLRSWWQTRSPCTRSTPGSPVVPIPPAMRRCL
jgi:hypothetical protein